MRRLIPKAHLKWNEPKLVQQAKDVLEDQSLSPWFKPGLAVAVAAMGMLQWWLAKQDPTRTPPELSRALPLSFVAGVFFAYLVPWLYRICPSRIQVFDDGIARSCGSGASVWKYKDIDRCEIATVQVGNVRQALLLIHPRKAKRILLGIPAEHVAAVADVLSRMPVKFAMPPSAESAADR